MCSSLPPRYEEIKGQVDGLTTVGEPGCWHGAERPSPAPNKRRANTETGAESSAIVRTAIVLHCKSHSDAT